MRREFPPDPNSCLVELLIVLTICVTILAILIPNLIDAFHKAGYKLPW